MKRFLKKIIPPQQRSYLKKLKRRVINSFKRSSKITLQQFKEFLLYELKLGKGDKIIVSSSYGNLNADFSPKELIELLQEIVTPEGLIMMPYYPPGNSYEWASGRSVFDMSETPSSMGVLTNAFSKMDGVIKSIHPTKAVCVWGKDNEEYAESHEKSKTPFGFDSPYGKLLEKGSKSLGLGLKNIPIFHLFEDVVLWDKERYYESEKYVLPVKKQDGSIVDVETYIHDASIADRLIPAGDYVRSLKCKSYIRKDMGYSFCYVIDNSDLYERCKIEFLKNNTRLKK